MSIIDKEDRGWGCLVLQAILGGVFLLAAFSEEPSRWRYGKAGALFVGGMIVFSVVIRVIANLVEASQRRPIVAGAVLIGCAIVASGTFYHTQKEDSAQKEAAHRERVRLFGTIHVGMTTAEVETAMGKPTTWDFQSSYIDHSHMCLTTIGARVGISKFVAWTRPDGGHDIFVGYDNTGHVAYGCFAAPCVAWDMAGKCIRYE
jgi:hypothetical protein